MKTVLIYSGGMDSTALLGKYIHDGCEVKCLNFWYGSKHNNMERQAARKIAGMYNIELHEVELDVIDQLFKSALLSSGEAVPQGHYAEDSMKKTVVPFRNAIMLSIAAGYAASIGYDAVSTAIHAGDHTIYPDCRPAFFDAFNILLEKGLWENVYLHAPFLHLSKGDICEEGLRVEAPLCLSYSCYEGGDQHCGKCGACTERREAFTSAGAVDFTGYNVAI